MRHHGEKPKSDAVYDQISPIVDRSVNLVSSCEELLFPWLANPEKASFISELEREYKRQVQAWCDGRDLEQNTGVFRP